MIPEESTARGRDPRRVRGEEWCNRVRYNIDSESPKKYNILFETWVEQSFIHL